MKDNISQLNKNFCLMLIIWEFSFPSKKICFGLPIKDCKPNFLQIGERGKHKMDKLYTQISEQDNIYLSILAMVIISNLW